MTLVAYGGMSDVVLQAGYELMLEDEIACEVVIPTHIKPLDLTAIMDSVGVSRRLAIFEEGTESWGWGREVTYRVLQKLPEIAGQTIACGARELPIGNSKTLEELTLPQVEDVKNTVKDLLRRSVLAP